HRSSTEQAARRALHRHGDLLLPRIHLDRRLVLVQLPARRYRRMGDRHHADRRGDPVDRGGVQPAARSAMGHSPRPLFDARRVRVELLQGVPVRRDRELALPCRVHGCRARPAVSASSPLRLARELVRASVMKRMMWFAGMTAVVAVGGLVGARMVHDAHAIGPTHVGVTNVSVSLGGFSPNAIEVHAGTTVTWMFDDDIEHDVVGGEGLQSPRMTHGTYTHTFDAPGTYEYRCSLHPIMRGRVVVDAAGR